MPGSGSSRPPLTIILGTGRCGSTMLSDLVGLHPSVLSLSEFFATLIPLAFPEGSLSGVEFWRILTEPRLKHNTLIRNGAAPPEFRYLERPRRFANGAIPPISLATLPALTDTPDALYDELEAEVTRWPTGPARTHYWDLFEWLAMRLRRIIIVERSGASLRFLPELAKFFPEARFVHIYRYGPDCALSMSKHPAFRLAAIITMMREYIEVDPFNNPSREHQDRVPAHLRPFLPDQFDGNVLRRADIGLGVFGSIWSQQLMTAAGTLAALPPERVLHVGYEALLADPITELARFGAFAGLPDHRLWSRSAAGQVDRRRTNQSAGLDQARREELVAACQIGTRVLRGLTARDRAQAADSTP